MRKKILIADDEPDIARTVSMMLESEGYEVVTAIDGQDAFDKAAAFSPDLIILDLVLPVIDGRAVAAMIKNTQRLKNVPVIFITAQTQKFDKELLKELPVDSYIFKPFDLYMLKDKIDNLFKSK